MHSTPSHYHWVKEEDAEQPVQFKCSVPMDPCPFSEATPEEIGIWNRDENRFSRTFQSWLDEHRKSVKANAEIAIGSDDPESAAIVDAVRKLTDEDGVTKGVPFVKYNEFGDKITLGFAILEEKDGFISASFTIDAKSLLDISPSKLFPRPTAAPPPATKEEEDKWNDMGVDWDRLKATEAKRVSDFEKMVHNRFEKDLRVNLDEDQDDCSDTSCMYGGPHKHGFACTSDCHCNRHGRVD